MRTLSLVDCVELKFSGNVLKNAICFGDCDNDGYSELILGNSNGEIVIFREGKCVCTSSELGTIAAIAVGDLLNIGRNVLVVVTIEGWCHIFDVESEMTCLQKQDETDISGQSLSCEFSLIWPFHSQRIPPNTKTLHLGDVNEDGLIEMVVGLTDRVLRTYQWRTEPLSDFQDERSFSKYDEKDDDTKSENSEAYDGRLFGVNKWEFANQIGSVALHKQGSVCSILVGQPGGTITEITERRRQTNQSQNNSSNNQALNQQPPVATSGSGPGSGAGSGTGTGPAFTGHGSNSNSNSSSASTTNTSAASTFQNSNPRNSIDANRPTERNESPSDNIVIQYHPLELKHMQNPNISTEVTGNILSADGKDFNSYGVATLDGTIISAREGTIEQSIQVDNQILSLHQVNGKMLACSWNGDTYLIDRKEPLIRFHFEDSVAAFIAGPYAVRDDAFTGENKLVNKNCLAFVTFQERVYVYPVELL